MTDAPPPSIPPSNPPRRRPTPEAAPRGVTTVPGRGGNHTNGTTGASARAAEAAPQPTLHVETERRAPARATEPPPAPPWAAEDPGRAAAPFPVVTPPMVTPSTAGSPDDEDAPDGPSPLAVAVEQTGTWLKRAASVTSTTLSAAYASLTRPRPEEDSMTAHPEAPMAPPRPVPPTAPAMTGGSPTVRPTSGRTPVVGPGPRRVRLAISRVDPWSVMKLAFLLSFAAGIMIVVAVSVLWLTLDGMHVFTSLNNLVKQIVGPESPINILDYVQFNKVLSITTLIAVVDVFLMTALATIGAFLYNVVAALVGGVHVTMTDE